MFDSIEPAAGRGVLRRLASFGLSLAAHVVLIGVVVVLPLLFFSAIPVGELLTFLIAPPPPPQTPMPPKPLLAGAAQAPRRVVATDFEPTGIPIAIPPPTDEDPVATAGIGAIGLPPGAFGSVLGGPGGAIGTISVGTPAAAPPPPPRPRPKQPIRVSTGVQESKLIQKVTPVYPPLAVLTRVSDIVILQVTVDEEGSVSDVRVLRGHPLLNDAAVEAVRRWRYSPTLLNGEPVPVIATVTVIFSLKR